MVKGFTRNDAIRVVRSSHAVRTRWSEVKASVAIRASEAEHLRECGQTWGGSWTAGISACGVRVPASRLNVAYTVCSVGVAVVLFNRQFVFCTAFVASSSFVVRHMEMWCTKFDVLSRTSVICR